MVLINFSGKIAPKPEFFTKLEPIFKKKKKNFQEFQDKLKDISEKLRVLPTGSLIANCLVLQPCIPSFKMALWHDTTFAGRTGRTREWSTPIPTWSWPFGTCPTRISTSSAIFGAPSPDRYRKNRWSDLRDSSNNWNQVWSQAHFILLRFGLNVLSPFSLLSPEAN